MSTQETPDKPSVTEEDGAKTDKSEQKPKEVGGRKGPEPTRYGDWEKNGRCIDF